jgi:hypothetical protein
VKKDSGVFKTMSFGAQPLLLSSFAKTSSGYVGDERQNINDPYEYLKEFVVRFNST